MGYFCEFIFNGTLYIESLNLLNGAFLMLILTFECNMCPQTLFIYVGFYEVSRVNVEGHALMKDWKHIISGIRF